MKNSILTILILLTTIFISCNKDDQEISGCTDSTAENYNPDASDDDGSCTYSQTSQNMGVDVYFLESNISIGGEMKIVVNGDTSTIYAAALFSDYNTAVTVQFALDTENDIQFINADTLFCSISQATVIQNSEESLLKKNGQFVYYVDEAVPQSYIPGTCNTSNECAEGEVFSGYNMFENDRHSLILEL